MHGGWTFYTSALLRIYWLETISELAPARSRAVHGDVALEGGAASQILQPADHLQRYFMRERWCRRRKPRRRH